MGRVTLQTIADRIGVSRMTVSNAFSRPDQLSPTLRDRILAVADELGYVGPDPAARALAKGTTRAVGILLTDSLSQAFGDEVATTFLGAIADELAPTGLGLTLLTTNAAGNVIPARDVAMDGAWCTRATRRTPASSGSCAARSRSSSSTRSRPTATRTSPTARAPGPPLSTWSTSATGGSGWSPAASAAPTACSGQLPVRHPRCRSRREESAVVDGYVAQRREPWGLLRRADPARRGPARRPRLAHGRRGQLTAPGSPRLDARQPRCCASPTPSRRVSSSRATWGCGSRGCGVGRVPTTAPWPRGCSHAGVRQDVLARPR